MSEQPETTSGDDGEYWSPPTPEERQRILAGSRRLAGLMLHASRDGRQDDVQTHFAALCEEFGGPGLQIAMVAFTDTLLAAYIQIAGPPPADGRINLMFLNTDTGEVQGADEVPRPEIVFAGRFMAARAAKDGDTMNALFMAIPEDEIHTYVGAILEATVTIMDTVEKNPDLIRDADRTATVRWMFTEDQRAAAIDAACKIAWPNDDEPAPEIGDRGDLEKVVDAALAALARPVPARIWSNRFTAWVTQDGKGYTQVYEHAGLFGRAEARELADSDAHSGTVDVHTPGTVDGTEPVPRAVLVP